jgi:RNA polymerase sigma-70 factor (ECF subfamily)
MRRERLVNELLVIRAQDGNEAALGRLVSRWQQRLWRHAFRLTGREDVAWDVLQEAWMAIVRGLRRLSDARDFPAWVYRIVTHKCVDWARRRRRGRRLEDRLAAQAPQPQDDPAAPAEQREALRQAMGRMDVQQRALLCLYYLEEFSVGRIARILDVPEGTVKSRLYHAREELKAQLGR